jgi:Uma2 family endonuclease
MASKKSKPEAAEHKPTKSKSPKRTTADSSHVDDQSAESKSAEESAAKKPRRKSATNNATHARNGKASYSSPKPAKTAESRRRTSRRPSERDQGPEKEESNQDGTGTEMEAARRATGGEVRRHAPDNNGLAKQDGHESRDHDDAIVSSLFHALGTYASSHGLGRVAHRMRFDWGNSEHPDLRPELAFVSFDRWAVYRHVPKALTWHVVPDLVVEVVDGSDARGEFASRLHEYFEAGVGRVWAVDLHKSQIMDYESPTDSHTLKHDQAIDGGAILPGFRLSIDDLKEES